MAKQWKKQHWAKENAMSEEEVKPEETSMFETPPIEEPPPVVVDPAKRATHPPVLASAGQACQVEGCGYIFGDPIAGAEPHPLELIGPKVMPKVEPPRLVPPPRPESTAKCEPIGVMNTCPSCGWNAKESTEPHPVTP